jgi:hypothetical protein
VSEPAGETTIFVSTPRRWFGEQQFGAFAISLDGKKAGVLMPEGALTLTCTAGHHSVRARQWWYVTGSIGVDAPSGGLLHLEVDLAHRDSLAKRMLTLMFRPWRGLVISIAHDDA